MKKRTVRRETSKASPPANGDAARTNSESSADCSFPIVGVGASAGGLEAFTQLLEDLPADTGMAFVLIQHLDPTHASFLARGADQGDEDAGCARPRMAQRVEPNHVYVIPPNADIGILHGRLTLLAAARRGAQAAPAHRLLLSRPRRRARQPRDRRGPLGNRLGRHRRAQGDQGGGRHHLRAGSRSRRSSAACRTARSTPASSTTRCPSPSSPRSSCA